MQIVEMVGVLDRLLAQLIGGPHNRASLDAASGEPHGHGRLVVFAPGGLPVVGQALGSATEFSSPGHQGLIQQAPLLEVVQQGRHGPVGFQASQAVLAGDILVGVPAPGVDLHEAHAPLHQSPGHEAPSAHGLGNLVVEPVHLPNGRRFLVHVQRFRHRHLHAEGQFVVLHPGPKVALQRVAFQVGPVEVVQQLNIGFLTSGGGARRGLQIHDGNTFRLEGGSLVDGRQVSIGPVLGPAKAPGAADGKHHEGRQILVLGSQPVDRPGTQRRTAGQRCPCIHQEGGQGVGVGVGVNRPHHRHVVHAGGQMGKHVRNFGAAPAELVEAEGASHVEQLPSGGTQLSAVEGRGAVVLVQQRLGIESVHLAGTARHEQENA